MDGYSGQAGGDGLPARLLPWYEKSARDLPWRRDTDPYRVWLSEIMLQQTRVDTVIPYYTRFLSALPSIAALAAAEEDQVFKLWEGLGYYSRARNLLRAARVIMGEHGGVFPRDYAAIRALPGVGDYTAGAISSICFGAATPAVDGNVTRVLARVLEITAPIQARAPKNAIRAHLQGLYDRLPPARRGTLTQALMELGATVCVPGGAPDCGACPLAPLCAAARHGTAAAIPVMPPKKKRKVLELTVFVLKCGGALALHRREADAGVLSGLWALPNTEGALDRGGAEAYLAGFRLGALEIAQPYEKKHIFTHLEWRMTCYPVSCTVRDGAFTWAEPEGLTREYMLPTAFRKCLTP